MDTIDQTQKDVTQEWGSEFAGESTEDAALWTALAAADNLAGFCSPWLALQCRKVQSTGAGLLLLQGPGGSYRPAAAIWPDGEKDISYLVPGAEQAIRERRGVVRSILASTGPIARVHVAFPIDMRGDMAAVVVLDVVPHAGLDLTTVFRQLHCGAGLLQAALLRQRATGETGLLARANAVLDLLAVAEEHSRLKASAGALANEVAARYGCERVSLGFCGRGGIRLRAMSHSAWFQRKSRRAELPGIDPSLRRR